MKFTRVNLTSFLILAILLSCACSEENSTGNTAENFSKNSNQTVNSTGKNTSSTGEDIDELGKIIKLPLLPECENEATSCEANYWEENLSGSGANQNDSPNKKLVAVLKFSPRDSAELVGNIEKIKPPSDAIIDSESRFPAELVAQSQLSGDGTLKGKAYAADDFLQAPYKNGKITRIENTDYFVLELTTK
jgi:hypothetical protein